MKESRRNPAFDLVRIVATFCVLLFHYVLWINFLGVSLSGGRMFILSLLRDASMICVPMFLMLTGSLMGKKQLSGRYYLGIVKTLCIYALAAAACYLYRKDLEQGLLESIIGFSAAEYDWYVEMYIGLFLLIPFLNQMYRGGFADPNAPEAVRYKRVLILTLLALAALPPLANTLLPASAWWGSGSFDIFYAQLVPRRWVSIYPIAYYVIGCYLSEYGLKLRPRTSGLLFLALVIVGPVVDILRARGGTYLVDGWRDWGSLPQVIRAVLAFHFLTSLDLHGIANGWKKALKAISDLCLGAYLVSFIFDDIFYTWLCGRVESVGGRLNYLPLVLVDFACSLALSALLNLVYALASRLTGKLLRKGKKPAAC